MSEEEIYVNVSRKFIKDKDKIIDEEREKRLILCQDLIKKIKEIEQLESKLQEKEKIIIIMEKYFELICDLGFDYDGCNTKESLKNLIDELTHYSNLGRVVNTTEKIYENQGKSFNILHEEIVDKELK